MNPIGDFETETASATVEETKEPTTTTEGVCTYTATFENAAFAAQTKTEAIPKIATYSVVEGDGATWTKGSSTTLDFTFKRSADDDQTFSHFEGVRIDGKVIDAVNYTTEAGSLVLKLNPSFLETLSAGKHEVIALFDDGSAKASFTVKANPAGSGNSSSSSPKTGDVVAGLFGTVLLLTVMSAAAAIIVRRCKLRC